MSELSARKTKASLITHPVRARLILTLMGRELTTQQMAALLPDIPRTSLYRHIRELTEAGVFEVVAETAIRGTVERRYAVLLRSATLSREDIQDAGHEEYLRLVTGFLGAIMNVYQAYLDRHEQGLAENTLLRVNSVNLTDEEFQQFRRQLTDLLTAVQANPLTPERRRRVIGLLGVPGQPAPPSEELTEEGTFPSS
jgi:DNA-binding HxlR family transcriptional regulator